uniref:Uncharacterized protein n=1 Tax=Arion vulgaris TaxID=1028688 RepID=A0A0B7BIG7_9EUPU
MVPGVRARGQPRRRRQQDIKETLNIRPPELARDREFFRQAVMKTMFCKRHATT